MQSKSIELLVGIFVAIGLAALFMLAMKVSSISHFSDNNTYLVKAHFDAIGGLKVRAPVTVAGVRVGQVQSIALDNTDYRAAVTIALNEDLLPMQKINEEGEAIYQKSGLPVLCQKSDKDCASPLFEDASASILTAGLLGEQYIGLDVGGGAPTLLEQNGEITITQSAIGLEQVIGQFLFNGNSDEKPDKEASDGSNVDSLNTGTPDLSNTKTTEANPFGTLE